MEYNNYNKQSKTEFSTGPQDIKYDFTYVKIPLADYVNMIERLNWIEEEIRKVKKNDQIMPIQFLESGKLLLKQPIVVSLGYSPESKIWIVDCPELNLYGEGDDEQQAIKDFKIILEETYFNLKKDKENLGVELKKKWNIFQRIIEEK